jgi:hypothetical protein
MKYSSYYNISKKQKKIGFYQRELYEFTEMKDNFLTTRCAILICKNLLYTFYVSIVFCSQKAAQLSAKNFL